MKEARRSYRGLGLQGLRKIPGRVLLKVARIGVFDRLEQMWFNEDDCPGVVLMPIIPDQKAEQEDCHESTTSQDYRVKRQLDFVRKRKPSK